MVLAISFSNWSSENVYWNVAELISRLPVNSSSVGIKDSEYWWRDTCNILLLKNIGACKKCAFLRS